MVTRAVLLLALASLVCCQVEQSIFAQFYPRYQKVQEQPATVKTVTVMSPPLLTVARSRRSYFDRGVDSEGNNALLRRLQPRMSDPGWVPEIRSRNKFFFGLG